MEIKQYKIPIRKVYEGYKNNLEEGVIGYREIINKYIRYIILYLCLCSCEKINTNFSQEFVTIELNNSITKSIDFVDFISPDIELTMTQISNGNKYKVRLNNTITIPKDTYIIKGYGGYKAEDYECNGSRKHWYINGTSTETYIEPWIKIQDTLSIFESKPYSVSAQWTCFAILFETKDVKSIDIWVESSVYLKENIDFVEKDSKGIIFITTKTKDTNICFILNPKTTNFERTTIKIPISHFKYGHYYKLEINNTIPIEMTNSLKIPIMTEDTYE